MVIICRNQPVKADFDFCFVQVYLLNKDNSPRYKTMVGLFPLSVFACTDLTPKIPGLVLGPVTNATDRIGRDDVTAHSNMRPPFSEVKASPGNRYLP